MELTVSTQEVIRFAPGDAAVHLSDHFAMEARRLHHSDWALQEDIAQEMRLAVLQCNEAMPLCFFKEVARNHAINFLKSWKRHGRIPYGLGVARRMTEIDQLKTSEESAEEEQEKEQQRQEALDRSMFYERRPYRKAG